MSIPLISPHFLVSNPSHINPLAHSTYTMSAGAAGYVAQQKTAQDKSDSVNISREALEKAAKPEGEKEDAKETQTQQAAEKTKAK
jgi:hypothetical protein